MEFDANDAYKREAFRTARFAFANWQREPASPSFGCFDRQFWGWKKKDIADAALQAAVTLVVRLAEAQDCTHSLPCLLEGYVGFLDQIQHRDGSFDQIYPNEHAPGVVHDLLSSLIWLWRSPHLDANSKRRLEAVIHRGAAYALTADEQHGEIANHFAHYAWEMLNYGRTFGHASAEAYGRKYLERTIALYRPDEGWFLEYDGADPGYQTRTLTFLAKIAEVTEDGELWSVIERGAGFVEAMLMPDNSLHPMLGVRSTALVYASSFERLAVRSPRFSGLADRIHEGWDTGASLLPSFIDFENGLRIADDAFEASALRTRRLTGVAKEQSSKLVAASPAASLSLAQADFDMIEAGLHRRERNIGDRKRTVLVASSLGGAVVIYDKAPAGGASLVHEDAGYLLSLADGSRWVLRRAGSGQAAVVCPDQIVLTATFQRALHEDLTPLKLILLRSLNLTVLRSQWIGDLFRKFVVHRLISGREQLPLSCRREIELRGGKITIRDHFSAAPALVPRLQGARLHRCRRTVANHMASSRYFQIQELAGEQPWLEEVSAEILSGQVVERLIG